MKARDEAVPLSCCRLLYSELLGLLRHESSEERGVALLLLPQGLVKIRDHHDLPLLVAPMLRGRGSCCWCWVEAEGLAGGLFAFEDHDLDRKSQLGELTDLALDLDSAALDLREAFCSG